MELSPAIPQFAPSRLMLLRISAGKLVRRMRDRLLRTRQPAQDQWQPAGGPVVVIAPHPDDEVIGCGGAVVRHIRAGDPVTIVLLTRGGKSVGYPWLTQEQRCVTREGESRASARLLGVSDIVFVDGEDGAMGRPDVKQRLEQRLGEIFASRNPRRVYVPHPNDGHPDHVAAYELVRDSLARISGARPQVLQYEVWRPLDANCAVDITEVMDLKLRAIKCHRLALDAFNYVPTLKGLAAYRSGTLLGTQGYAEAFHREDGTISTGHP